MKRLIELGKRVWAWWESTRAGRALDGFSTANGAVLSGGMAYAALFSLFAALAIGYTVFVRLLGADAGLRVAVLAQVDTWVPGLVDTGDGGILSPSDLVLSPGLNWTSIVAAAVLLWSATGFMGALRTSVRAMFGETEGGGNPLTDRLRQLLGFVLLGVGVLVTAAASIAVAAAVPWTLELVGLGAGASWAVRGVGLLLTVLLDAAVVAAVIRYVGGVRPPGHDLLRGSLAVGVVAGALRLLGTGVIATTATRNALLASFTVVVTLLVLVNLLARVLLLATAWMSAATPTTKTDADLPDPALSRTPPPQRGNPEPAPTTEPRAEGRGGRP
jgi:membrane protein